MHNFKRLYNPLILLHVTLRHVMASLLLKIFHRIQNKYETFLYLSRRWQKGRLQILFKQACNINQGVLNMFETKQPIDGVNSGEQWNIKLMCLSL